MTAPVAIGNQIPLILEAQRYGVTIDSRYGRCREVFGGQFHCTAGSLVTRPGINWSLGWMELLQLIAGVFHPDGLKRVAPKADHSLFTPQMAYGPRVADQIWTILGALRADPLTRQAVVFVGKPDDGPTSDLPCTLTIQFRIVGGELNACVSMRSWDLCRGLPYDIMMFSGLQMAVARCLGLPAGMLIVTAGSAHIYEEWSERTPIFSEKFWVFDSSGPETWKDFVWWAQDEIPRLEKGGTPSFIEYRSW